MAGFNSLPEVVENIKSEQAEIKKMLSILLGQKREIEKPIDSRELKMRLDISEPTLIAMRKRGDIPYINVRGNYRYVWSDVLTALNNHKK